MRSSPNSPRYATDPRPADKPETDANRSIRQASVTAGAGLLLMSALAGFGCPSHSGFALPAVPSESGAISHMGDRPLA